MSARRRTGRRGRWTLRRRLTVLIAVLTVLALTGAGAISTLALRGSLYAQLDGTLRATSDRAMGAPPPGGFLPDGGADGGADDGRPPPPGLDVRGQPVGTISLTVRDGVAESGRIGADGAVEALTAAQLSALQGLDPAGEPVTLRLDGIGTYRLLARTTADGSLTVTGLPTDTVDGTVRGYVLTEALVTLAAVALASTIGGLLVRDQLRPLSRVAATATAVSRARLASGAVAPVDRVPPTDTDPGTEVGQVGAALSLSQ